jgi:peptidoglycan-N-acetylglucosamine deacetylase
LIKILVAVTVISLALAVLTSVALSPFVPVAHSRFGIAGVIFLLVEAILLFGVFEPRAPLFGRMFWRGAGDRRAVTLTFDDGPNEPYTSQILDILKTLDVKAAFFPIGKNAESFPETLRRAAAEGHEIGNHTYDHDLLPLKSARRIRDQIDRTSALIEAIIGHRPRFFRAPHGWRNPWVNGVAREAGCEPVAWTLGVWDTDRPGTEVIVRRTLKGLGNGCVLLVHDGRGTERGADASQMVAALPVIIDEARRAGYSFVALSDMMGHAVITE